MSVILIMLPIAFLLAGGAVLAFIRAARSGQFDDLDTPSVRMLHDDGAEER
ncbi:MAG: cbb3-type cytochrome oxidase assembly protein CcoS [Phycisphaeraceae bacterium]|nr:cbb3-type cytochrome oxidase assembly protein CcoS [Phycisphaeraceae bacterium]